MAWCDRCERYFVNERALQQHRNNSSMHWICYRCDRDFVSEWALTQHRVQSSAHHYCQRCDEDFDSHSELLEHYEDAHWYCRLCGKFFENERGLHEHNRQKHWYCESCKRVFQSESNLNSHLRSSVHQPRTVRCPGRSCGRAFVSVAALVLHFESGTCVSGVTRQEVNRVAVQLDRGNVITNPSRLIQGPDGYTTPTRTVTMWATQRSWNGRRYECMLCHSEHATLAALDQHLASPAHEDNIYRCPRGYNGCGSEFSALSALCQHVESGQCGVWKFKSQMQQAIGSITDGMRRIAV